MSVNTSVNAEDAQKDTDKDGLTDAFELKIGSEAYLSDTDGDGIKDGDEIGDIENPLDTDSDKVIDVLDYDDDDDGLPTYLEAKGDSDKDGLLDYLDPDSDNDSILDGVEAAYLDQDKNFDGIDDAFDSNRKGFIDVNGDGIDDNVKLPDYNNDGIPDYLDNNYPKQNNNESTAKKTIESQPSSPDDKQTLKELSEAPTQKKSLNDEVAAKEKKKKSASVNSKENKTVKEKVEPPKVIVNKHTDTDNDGLSNDLERILKTDHLTLKIQMVMGL